MLQNYGIMNLQDHRLSDSACILPHGFRISFKELRELYTPTPTDIAFVTTRARGDGPQFALMILLKVFQRLGYFPNPQEIPGAVISHIQALMQFPDDLIPDKALSGNRMPQVASTIVPT